MKVTLLLADSAQAVDGKLYILGGGWSTITVGHPFAIAMKVEVPWNQGTDEHSFRLELLDMDGHPVCVETEDDDAPAPIIVEGMFATGVPPGLKPGTPLDGTVAFPIGFLPLEPGQRYEWRLSIDGRSEDDWYLAFNTRPVPPATLAS
jgi:hypothetical protein